MLEEELIKPTKEDQHLQLLLKTIKRGFPEKNTELPAKLQYYFNFKEELTYLKGIIFKGHKIVVPKSQITKMLKNINQGTSRYTKQFKKSKTIPSLERTI